MIPTPDQQMPRVSKRVAKELDAEAESALQREKQIKQLLVRAEEMVDFWWERLDCKACREELLGIMPLKPITSRHALGIDVYEAKAICSRLKITSIGELFNKYQLATQDADEQHQFWGKVQASCASKTKSAKLMELFGRLLWIKDIGRWKPPSAEAHSKAKASFLSFRHSLRIREREARFGQKGKIAQSIQKKKEAASAMLKNKVEVEASRAEEERPEASNRSVNSDVDTEDEMLESEDFSKVRQLRRHNSAVKLQAVARGIQTRKKLPEDQRKKAQDRVRRRSMQIQKAKSQYTREEKRRRRRLVRKKTASPMTKQMRSQTDIFGD